MPMQLNDSIMPSGGSNGRPSMTVAMDRIVPVEVRAGGRIEVNVLGFMTVTSVSRRRGGVGFIGRLLALARPGAYHPRPRVPPGWPWWWATRPWSGHPSARTGPAPARSPSRSGPSLARLVVGAEGGGDLAGGQPAPEHPPGPAHPEDPGPADRDRGQVGVGAPHAGEQLAPRLTGPGQPPGAQPDQRRVVVVGEQAAEPRDAEDEHGGVGDPPQGGAFG